MLYVTFLASIMNVRKLDSSVMDQKENEENYIP